MTAPKNPKPLGMPVTLTTAQVLRNQEISRAMDEKRTLRRRGINTSALQPAGADPFTKPVQSTVGGSRADREAAAIKASYHVGDTTPSKIDLRRGDIPGPLLLEVTTIEAYKDNPRLFRNEKYADIRAAIQAQGFHDALVVTRKREGDPFMLAAGSNTTLEVLKELWEATKDERYRWVNCIFQPYEDDARLMAQHLGENLNRGDMKFWEIAVGMMKLIDMVQEQRLQADPGAKPLSQRDMTEALTSRGLKADKTAVARWQFAVERLRALGNTAALLNARRVGDVIQPRLIACRSLAGKFSISEPVYWSEIVDPSLARYAAEVDIEAEVELDAEALCSRVEAALAERVSESLAGIRQMLSLLKVAPDLTLADLRTPSPSLIASPAPGSAGTGSAATQASAPQASSQQRPLPLGPSVVRDQAKGGGASPAPAAAPAPQANATAAPTPAPLPPAPQPSAHGPLFASAQGLADPMLALHAGLEQLLADVGLHDTLRWCDEMPLGFYIELPDPALHPRQRVSIGSPEFMARIRKTAVWWQLVLMTGQLNEGCVPYMDRKSQFYLRFASDEGDPLDGTDIDRDPPELQASLLQRMAPSLRKTMQQLRQVEELAAHLLQSMPERWKRMKEIQQTVL